MGSRNARRSVDLLVELTVLHSHVEKELEAVQFALVDLLHNETKRHSSSSAVAAQRRFGGARDRILDALARQRLLLWEFSVADDPMIAQTRTGGSKGTEHANDPWIRTASPVGSFHDPQHKEQQNGLYGEATTATCRRRSASVMKGRSSEKWPSGELEWKRDTLVRMQHLLRRKAEEGTAREADSAMIRLDMAKVDAALEHVRYLQQQRERNQPQSTNARVPVQPDRCTAAVPVVRRAPVPAHSTGRTSTSMMTGGDGSVAERAGRAMAADDENSHTRARPTSRREERAREHGDAPAASSANGRCRREETDEPRSEDILPRSGCGGQSSREEELRLPNGLDLLLRRISEGVRPALRRVEDENPLQTTSTQRDDDNADADDNEKKWNADNDRTSSTICKHDQRIGPTISTQPSSADVSISGVSSDTRGERKGGEEAIMGLTAVLGQSDRVVIDANGRTEGCRRGSRERSRSTTTNIGEEHANWKLVVGEVAVSEQGGKGPLSARAANEIGTTNGKVLQGRSRRRDPNSVVSSGVRGGEGGAGDRALLIGVSTTAAAAVNGRPPTVPGMPSSLLVRSSAEAFSKMGLARRAVRGGSGNKENCLR